MFGILTRLFVLVTCVVWARHVAAQQSEPSREQIVAAVARDFGISPASVEKEPWNKILDQDNWYHKCRVMQWPAFARASTRTVAPAGGQGDYVCKGVDDDIQIQKAIDSLPKEGGKVVLLPGTYLLGNCIRLRDNTELEIQGTLKVADAVTSPLTADVQAGQTTIQVANASRFRVGQWVTLMDDDPRKDFHAGRKYGESVVVQSIQGNAITVGDPLAVRWAKTSTRFRVDGYLVAKKAYVTTSHSAILVLDRKRVYLHGAGQSGAIDGNRTGQSPTSPLMCSRSVEDLRANCGISIVDSSCVKVDRLNLRDANLHNIAVYNSQDCEVTGVEAARSNDKNICVIQVAKVRLMNNHCRDSLVEDGICCHGPVGPYLLVAWNRTTGNPRFGIHLGIKNDYAIVARNVALSNRIDLCVIGVPPFTKYKGRTQENKGLIVIENSVSEKKSR